MFVRMTKEQLKEKMNFIKVYAGSINAATASEVDPNANITSKNVATLMPDLFKDFNVQLKRALISEKISYNHRLSPRQPGFCLLFCQYCGMINKIIEQ